MTMRPSPARKAVQREILDVLLKGGSLMLAAQQAGQDVLDVLTWREDDAQFARKCQLVEEALNQNVIAKLYHEAMSGSIQALTLWLRERSRAQAQAAEEDSTSFWQEMTDEELSTLARRLATSAEDATGQRDSLAPDPPLTGVLPRATEAPGRTAAPPSGAGGLADA